VKRCFVGVAVNVPYLALAPTLLRLARGQPEPCGLQGRTRDSESYDVVAKPAADVTLNQIQFKVAIQALLADRFKLKIHRETRDLPIYSLVLERTGRS